MKVLLFSSALSLMIPFHAFCQIYYDFISPPTFFKVNRSVYTKYFENRQKLIFLDHKEGLSLTCIKVLSNESLQSSGEKSYFPYFMGKFWHIYDDLADDGLVVYFPEEQDVENWQEMISIQRIDGQGQSSNKLYTLLMKAREERCPGMTNSEIIEDAKKYTLYKSTSEKCGEIEPQKELSIILAPPKLLVGQYTLWKVEYVIRNSNQEMKFTDDHVNWVRSIELLTGKELGEYLD